MTAQNKNFSEVEPSAVQSIFVKFIRLIGNNLPDLPHSTAIINRIIKPIYTIIYPNTIIANVLGIKMLLNPKECVDGRLLFYPEKYDPIEINFLLKNTKIDGIFVDVGSNIGFYSLVIAKNIPKSNVIAIEAHPEIANNLDRNIKENQLDNIKIINCGVGGSEKTLNMFLNETGNAGGNSFHEKYSNLRKSIPIPIRPLYDILNELGVREISAMKMDIEGLEEETLVSFFKDAPESMHPSVIILEKISPDDTKEKAEPDRMEICICNGYKINLETSENMVLIKK